MSCKTGIGMFAIAYLSIASVISADPNTRNVFSVGSDAGLFESLESSQASTFDTSAAIRGSAPLPLGTVVSWLKSFPNNPQELPVGWVECNGQILDDPDSLFHGQEIPDLNGGFKILQGSTGSGEPGAGLDSSPHGMFTNHPGSGNWPLTSDDHLDEWAHYVEGDTAITNPVGDFGKSRTYTIVWIMKVRSFDSPSCPEDVHGDGVVDVLDLLAVLSAWGPCP